MASPLTQLAIFGMGMQELVVIFLVLLLLIGPKALPALARALGQGLREFKSAANTFQDEMQKDPPAESAKPVEPSTRASAPK